MQEKFEKLMQDEAFAEKLLSLDEDTEIQALLSENGVEFTLEQIAAIKKGVIAQLNGEDAELSEDDLEDVAGGIAVGTAITVAVGVAKGLFALGKGVHKWTRGRW